MFLTVAVGLLCVIFVYYGALSTYLLEYTDWKYLAGWECHSLVSYYKHMTVFAVSIFVHVVSVY